MNENKVIQIIKSNRVLSHIIFWLALFLLDFFQDLILHVGHSNLEILGFNLFSFIAQIIASYFLAYFWIPIFVKTKRYLLAIFVFLIGIYLISVFSRILIVHVAEPIFRTPPFEQESILEIFSDYKSLLKKYTPSVLFNAFVFVGVKYFLSVDKERTKNLTIEKQKSALELKTLKAQLNPHFLFNTLNNIYSLAIEQSKKTPDAIGKLSDILDYILYKCDEKLVPLRNEIELLENYIELEKLRYDERLNLSFRKEINCEVKIPPLVLLSLVENAFKHGAGEDGGSPYINISVVCNKDKFGFMVMNSIVKGTSSKSEKSIGLNNVRKQLDLIYANDYVLNIEHLTNEFIVTLSINHPE